MPTLRRKKEVATAYNEVLAAVKAEAPVPAAPSQVVQAREAARAAESIEAKQPALPTPAPAPVSDQMDAVLDAEPQDGENGADLDDTAEGRVHRRLIRATLPRPENHQVVRPVPEFTMRQPTARPGKFRGGMARGTGGRPGAMARGGGNANGNTRNNPMFARSAGGRSGAQAGRPGGRNEGHRPPRGGHPSSRPGKKPSK